MGTRKEGEIKKEENRNVKIRKDFRTTRTEGKRKKRWKQKRKNRERFEEEYKGG